MCCDPCNWNESELNMFLRGFDAIVVQHENDHIDGVLITDHPEVVPVYEKSVERQKERNERLREDRIKRKQKEKDKQLLQPRRPLSKKKREKERKKFRKIIERQEKIALLEMGISPLNT